MLQATFNVGPLNMIKLIITITSTYILFTKLGNFSKTFPSHNFSTNKRIPNIKPQITKFQLAPCQIPVNIHTIKIFLINIGVPFLFPPSGIYT